MTALTFLYLTLQLLPLCWFRCGSVSRFPQNCKPCACLMCKLSYCTIHCGRPPSQSRLRRASSPTGGAKRRTAGGWGHPPLRRVTIDFVGAAVPSGPSITGAPPWSPSSVTAAPCHLPPGEGFLYLAFPPGKAILCPDESPLPQKHPFFVPSAQKNQI